MERLKLLDKLNVNNSGQYPVKATVHKIGIAEGSALQQRNNNIRIDDDETILESLQRDEASSETI